MFDSSTNHFFFLSILLIFLSTSVFSDNCDPKRTCYDTSTSETWCCSDNQHCGTSDSECEDDENLSPIIIATIIVALVIGLIICLTCCFHMQQRRRLRNENIRGVTNPHQRQALRDPVGAIHGRRNYNTGAAPPAQIYPSMYDEPPPSYEAAIADLPPTHQSPSTV